MDNLTVNFTLVNEKTLNFEMKHLGLRLVKEMLKNSF